MPMEDGGRNSVKGRSEIKEDGDSESVPMWGGDVADQIVGVETCR